MLTGDPHQQGRDLQGRGAAGCGHVRCQHHGGGPVL